MTGKEAKEKLKKGYDYRNNYTKQNYDRISVTVPKGLREKIKNYLPEKQTVNGLINDLINGWLSGQEQPEVTQSAPDPIRTKPEEQEPLQIDQEPEEPQQIDTIPEDAWKLPFM